MACSAYEGRVYYKECVIWNRNLLFHYYKATKTHKDFQIPELSKRGVLMDKDSSTKSDMKGGDGEGAADKDSEEICHFYNMLWIERRDGIAYRQQPCTTKHLGSQRFGANQHYSRLSPDTYVG